ncbi:MAG TPA: phytanoyl-CoA dioxygenase family protein [Planctomycetota bacterium]|nr:phytanoyl-CoA dioxygenase family protein [Planctomycetota bacterium]
MLTIPCTADDRRSGGLAPQRLAPALAALRDDGVVALTDAVDPAHVAALRARMLGDLDRVLARGDVPFNWNESNLQQSAPREAPLLFRDVLANDQAVAVCRALMGAGLHNSFYSGNTTLPGRGAHQPIHVDNGHLWPAVAGIAPPHAVVVNLPLVDIDERNAIELWPGSHRDVARLHGETLEIPATDLDRRRAFAPPLQPTLPAGSLLIRDIRLWHAGTVNRAAGPRPMLALIYCAAWWRGDDAFELPRAAEAHLRHPHLRTAARWVDHAIDHTGIDQAYGYAVRADATA